VLGLGKTLGQHLCICAALSCGHGNRVWILQAVSNGYDKSVRHSAHEKTIQQSNCGAACSGI
jgi:hypothetical protein